MKIHLTVVCMVLFLAARAAAQGVIHGDVAFAGSVYTTNAYGQPAGLWAAVRQGGAWTNDGAYVWYRLAATNRQGRSEWVYSTNDVVLNVSTGRQSSSVSWTNALGGVSGFVLQRRETTNTVADPSSATSDALWTRWQSLSPRVGTAIDLSWTNWSTNAWSDLPSWSGARLYPWSRVESAESADYVTGPQSNMLGTALQPFWAATGTVAHAVDATRLSVQGDGDYWVSLCNGTTTTWRVSDDTTRVYIVSASQDFNGPPVGTVFTGGGEVWTAIYEPMGDPFIVLEVDGEEFYNWGLSDGGVNDKWGSVKYGVLNLPIQLAAQNGAALGTCVIDWGKTTNSYPLATHADISTHDGDEAAHPDIRQTIDGATNALIQTYFMGTNAWMSISNQTLTIWRETNGVPVALWSSAESEGGIGIDPAFTNAVWDALAGKADAAWGKYAPDGSANPDPAYMTFLNAPATMHASGYQWATYGAYSVMAESGAVAYESGADGTVRWGLDLQTNYVGFVRGGSVIVAARAGAITVTDGGTTNGIAEIDYPYTSGDFPALWFAPALDVPFSVQTGVVWIDNEDGTATVTAPATTPKGFWYATTTSTYDVMFDIRPPARLTGGVFGHTNAPPVVYDAVITVTSGGKTYRIPAQEVIP